MADFKNARDEAASILKLAGGDLYKAYEILERQLFVLYTRAQVLISLAGVVLTVTGFSGRNIAGTSLVAQLLIISGLAIVLISAILVYFKVMRIRWATSDLTDDPIESLATLIYRRNEKTKGYRTGGIVLFLGLLLFCAAFSLMLIA